MKKALKIVACLVIAMTVALAMNVSNASAQPAKCDKSAAPTCSTMLYPGECQKVPLGGYDLAQIEISFPEGLPVPGIYPPPTVFYNIDVCDTQVSAKLNLAATATYGFKPPLPCQGQVCNYQDPITWGYPMPFELEWKNIPSEWEK
ncbi:MAG: hypothetical protein AB4352_12380 [Hormoscilla sp.]